MTRPFAALGVCALLLIALFALSAIAAKPRPGIGVGNSYTGANPYLRAPNYTLNISKIPADVIAQAHVTPVHQVQQDVLVQGKELIRFDPRACGGEAATCYQVIAHNETIAAAERGVNRTNLGAYVFPFRRIRFFTCIGDDLACVREARACWCPHVQPLAQEALPASGACSDTVHLCQSSPGIFTLCKGNLTVCRERYGACGCGKYGTCTSSPSNSCLNTRNELITCKSSLADCLAKYRACACGPTALAAYHPACDEPKHRCSFVGTNLTCIGSLQSCALQYDTCSCGVS